ncbi:MAG: ABC transporter ATP-binding protein, partial [Planctomycetota bacterium]
NEILAFAERGGSVVFISADLDEIVNMCHRMFVISRGRLIGPFAIPLTEDATQEVGVVMAGGSA